jgi:DNA polymerase-3 subunit delta'
MAFSGIIGQEMVVQLLKQSLKQNKIAHAYLFCGPEGVGKGKTALAFARTLLCERNQTEPCGLCRSCLQSALDSHPDLIFLRPEGGSLKIEQVRRWQQSQSYRPYWGTRKVSIIENSDKMTTEAANSILKTVEEPGPGTVLILLAHQAQGVLPTIVSRCQVVNFRPLTKGQLVTYLDLNHPQLEAEDKQLLAQLSGGSISKANQLIGEGDAALRYAEVADVLEFLVKPEQFGLFSLADRFEGKGDKLLDYLDLLSLFLRDLLLWKTTGRTDLLWNRKIVDQYGADLEKRSLDWFINCLQRISQTKTKLKQNVNIRLALEVMFLKLGQNSFSS